MASSSAESCIRKAVAERGLTPGLVGLADAKAEDEPRAWPGYGICKQLLDRRARRPGGSPETEGRQAVRSGCGRARLLTEGVAPTAGPPRTSRERPPVQGILGHLTRWLRRSRTYHDAAARGGLRYGGRPDRSGSPG